MNEITVLIKDPQSSLTLSAMTAGRQLSENQQAVLTRH